AAEDGDALPPGRDVRDGPRARGRGERAAGGTRHGRPARGRRLGHADPGGRQHARPDGDDRREGRRPDPRPHAPPEGRPVTASLLVTCLGDALFPEVGVATVRLLRRLGVTVDFPGAQTCCGQPHFNSGYHAEARALARHTIEAFEASPLVVAPSGSCAAMVKLEYPELFHDDPAWRRRAEALGARTHELSDYLVNVLGVEDVGAHFPWRVTYHMACHLRGLGLLTEPERLLRHVA